MRKPFLAVITALFLFIHSSSYSQTIRYVNQNALGSANGATWDDAYNTLQPAIDEAVAGDTLWVAGGYYTGPFSMKSGVVLLGGFAGTETSSAQRNLAVNKVYLQGDYASPIITNTGVDNSAVLDGFILSDNFNSSGDRASAIHNDASSPAIVNCVFYGNFSFAATVGGTIVNSNGAAPRIINCVFYGNYSNVLGAAISNNSATAQVINCTFYANSADQAGIYYGAAGSGLIFINNVCWGNSGSSLLYDDGSGNIDAQYSYLQEEIVGTGNVTGIESPFVDENNPSGNDGIWATADDGLRMGIGFRNLGTPDTTGLGLPAIDLKQSGRISGTAIEMGAYEFIEITDITELFVGANTGSDSNPGYNWETALQSLQKALELANADPGITTIHLQEGIYSSYVDNPDSCFLVTRSGLKIYGGYSNDGLTRNATMYPVYLQGGNAHHIMVLAGIGASADSVILDGLIFRNGGTAGDGDYLYNGVAVSRSRGGAVVITGVDNSTAIGFRHCQFYNNNAAEGGAVYSNANNVLFSNSLLAGNLAASQGGALYNDQGSFILVSSTLSGNNAPAGGAIYNASVLPGHIQNSIIWGNSSGVADNGSVTNVTYSIMQDGQFAANTGIIDQDPNFKNAPNYSTAPFSVFDYTLSACAISPAYNAGNITGVENYTPLTDLAGNTRTSLGALDIGVYEMTVMPVNEPTILHVDATAGNDANDGSSWNQAYKTLGAALAKANTTACVSEVRVAQGIYYPTGLQTGTDRAAYFTITRVGFKLAGGYDAATGLQNIATNKTYLDGDIGTAGDQSDNSYHVVVVGISAQSFNGENTEISGFTIRNGNADITGDEYIGGKLIRRDYGGGMNVSSNSAVRISHCIFLNNRTVNSGGGATIENSEFQIDSCSFIGNQASARGGGLYNYWSNTNSVNNSLFESNHSQGDGGGLYSWNGSTKLFNSIVRGNTATGNGGGIYYLNVNTFAIGGCLITGNTAGLTGGGMWSNSTAGASPDIFNCTFAGNKAASGGAYRYNHNGANISTDFTNCIIWGNSSGIEVTGTPPDVEYSCVQGGFSGTGNVNTDPHFVFAPDYTTAPFTNGDYHLSICSSPLINAGINNNAGFPQLNYDLDGNARKIGANYDMGVYEFDPTRLPLATAAGTHTSTHSLTHNNIRHFYDCDNLLLSLNMQSSGAVIADDGVKIQVTEGATYYPAGTGFVTPVQGAAHFNRQWSVTAATQPNISGVTVYNYYTAADYNSVNDTLAGRHLNRLSSEQQMYFYKVTNHALGEFPAIADINSSDVVILQHGSNPTISAWTSATIGQHKAAVFKVSSFSGGGGGGNGVGGTLPLTLLSLEGRRQTDQKVYLEWYTADEDNTSHFVIERSADAIRFMPIGNRKAVGAGGHRYEFVDPIALQGTNYYRLKMLDQDGRFRYSKVISIRSGLSTLQVKITPNPAREQTMLLLEDQKLIGTRALLYDLNGKLKQKILLQQQTKVLLNNYVAGIYFLKLANGQVEKIIVE